MNDQTCDVLIVGAGPVGLLLALLLQQQGVDARIVERQKSLYPLPRAVAFDHESRRLFGLAGMGDRVDTVLQRVINPTGGDEGSNYVWRDADLRRECSISGPTPVFPLECSAHYYLERSYCGSAYGTTHAIWLRPLVVIQSARCRISAREGSPRPEDPAAQGIR